MSHHKRLQKQGYSGSSIPSQAGGVANVRPGNSKAYFPNVIPESPQQVAAKYDLRFVTNPSLTYRSYEILVPQESITIVSPNLNRRYLAIQNKNELFTVQIAHGTNAVVSGTNSWDIQAGNSIVWDSNPPNNDIQAACTPTAIICIVEGFLDSENSKKK